MFAEYRLSEAADLVRRLPWWDGETHHGELVARYVAEGATKDVAALAATIQSGYWPDWLDQAVGLRPEEKAELDAHVKRVQKYPAWGTTSFGGWAYPDAAGAAWGAGL